MAWKAKLSSEISAVGSSVDVRVSYYDDVQPTIILHQASFAMRRDDTLNTIRDQIISEGQAVRAAKNQAASLATQFPMSTTVINIP